MFIGVATPVHAIYADICCFARRTYAQRLAADILPAPDAFAYAEDNSGVVACIGLYRAVKHSKLMIERYVPDAFERTAGCPAVERDACAEIGTRAISRAAGSGGSRLPVALSAALLMYAYTQGLRYLVFTSNRTAVCLARTLEVELIYLGQPDTSRMEPSFLKNWRAFFRVRQSCFGLRLDSVAGCENILEKFREQESGSAIR
jgi:hypothetical protein